MNHVLQSLGLMTCLALSPLAQAASETRELPPFNGITSQGAYTLVVTVGQKQSVQIEGDSTMLAKIKTTVDGEQLTISLPSKTNVQWEDKAKVTITVPQLTAFRFEGAGQTTLKNLSGDQFRLNYQGVGSLSASGQVQRFVVRAQGVGQLDARDLQAKHVDARLEGVGSVDVRASESLTARVEGVGSLTYFGRPAKVDKNVSGVGYVRAGD